MSDFSGKDIFVLPSERAIGLDNNTRLRTEPVIYNAFKTMQFPRLAERNCSPSFALAPSGWQLARYVLCSVCEDLMSKLLRN